MKVIRLAPHLLALSLLLHLTEGKPMLEQIAKRSAVLATFNGQRIVTTRSQSVPNYSMPNSAGTIVTDINGTQATGTQATGTQTHNLIPVLQVLPNNVLSTNNYQQVLPLNYGSQTFPQAAIPTYGTGGVQILQGFPQVLPQVFPQVLPAHSHTQFQAGTPLLNFNPGFVGQNFNAFQGLPQVPSHSHTPFQVFPPYTPGLNPGFAPQVYPHSHTPVQVPAHSHQPVANPNPGLVVIQVPVPQFVQGSVNTTPSPIDRATQAPVRTGISNSALLTLLLRQIPTNTVQAPGTVVVRAAAAGGGSSSGGSSD